jgi:hypothetical protein
LTGVKITKDFSRLEATVTVVVSDGVDSPKENVFDGVGITDERTGAGGIQTIAVVEHDTREVFVFHNGVQYVEDSL